MCYPHYVAEPTGHSRFPEPSKETARSSSPCSAEPVDTKDLNREREVRGEFEGDLDGKSALYHTDDSNEMDQSDIGNEGLKGTTEELDASLGGKEALEGSSKRKLSSDVDQESKETVHFKKEKVDTSQGEEKSKSMKTNDDETKDSEDLINSEEDTCQKGKHPQKWNKASTVHTSRDVEIETNIIDDRETTLTKAVNLVVSEEVAEQEDGEDEDSRLVVSGSWDVAPVDGEGKPGLRVEASCSIHRQENVTRTVITGKSKLRTHSAKLTLIQLFGS